MTLRFPVAWTKAHGHQKVTTCPRETGSSCQASTHGRMERDMSDVLESAVCVDGCIPAAPDHFVSASGAKASLAIEVISDAICPWCWVAKRRLDRAIAALAPDVTASVTWHPFELNPEMPRAGVDRRAYRSAKFGSWQRSQTLDAQVAAAGRSEGLVFNHDKIERTPNTIDAHRLIWLAGQQGKQGVVAEGLFAAYFNEGRDIGDPAVLADIGASAGLDRSGILAMLASDEGQAEVRSELQRALNLRVSGVPTVLVDGVPHFTGAIRTDLMEVELRKAAGHVRS
jgi:predicted DsbA family dithiol-disulfide isomerase